MNGEAVCLDFGLSVGTLITTDFSQKAYIDVCFFLASPMLQNAVRQLMCDNYCKFIIGNGLGEVVTHLNDNTIGLRARPVANANFNKAPATGGSIKYHITLTAFPSDTQYKRCIDRLISEEGKAYLTQIAGFIRDQSLRALAIYRDDAIIPGEPRCRSRRLRQQCRDGKAPVDKAIVCHSFTILVRTVQYDPRNRHELTAERCVRYHDPLGNLGQSQVGALKFRICVLALGTERWRMQHCSEEQSEAYRKSEHKLRMPDLVAPVEAKLAWGKLTSKQHRQCWQRDMLSQVAHQRERMVDALGLEPRTR